MPSREEALRRIFEATGVSARLSEEQRRELLHHLEDAVEAKVDAGAAEMDAVGQAFAELGDLEKIAKQFPKAPPVAVTPEGVRVQADGRSLAWIALCHLVFFVFLGGFIAPRFAEVYRQVKVPLPGLTLLFLNLGNLLGAHPLVPLAVVLALGGSMAIFRRRRVAPAFAGVLLVVSVALCLALTAALFLPLLSLLEGIGRR